MSATPTRQSSASCDPRPLLPEFTPRDAGAMAAFRLELPTRESRWVFSTPSGEAPTGTRWEPAWPGPTDLLGTVEDAERWDGLS